MSVSLLQTKIKAPILRPNLIARPELDIKLDTALGFHNKLTLVSAPAGYGKTTLIAQWAISGGREVSWLNLDEQDNDPYRFYAYLIAALDADGGMTGGINVSPSIMQKSSVHGLMTSLIDDLTKTQSGGDRHPGKRRILVLDNYQTISSDLIHDLVSFFLDNQPPFLHLVIISRKAPPLSLSALRASGRVTDIKQRDLVFSCKEISEWFKLIGRALTVKEVEQLDDQVEGWAVGLQFAASAVQNAPDSKSAIFAFKDRQYVMDYLTTEVFQQQPEVIREFIKDTSVLEWFTPDLCKAVTGRDDAEEIIERLEMDNLFLFQLERGPNFFRYHRLFAEFLRSMLSVSVKSVLNLRAAQWYEKHGFAEEAVSHALAAGDESESTRIIRVFSEKALITGNVNKVRTWIELLPESILRSSSELMVFKGWLVALSGEMEQAMFWANAAEGLLGRGDSKPASLWLLRGFLALFSRRDYKVVVQSARNALKTLDDEQSYWHIMAYWLMAEVQERTEKMTEAITTWRKACRYGRAFPDVFFSVLAEIFLISALDANGQRREAVAVCEAAIRRFSKDGEAVPFCGPLFSWLGSLYCEANQLELARQNLQKGVELGEKIEISGNIISSHGLYISTLCALGEWDTAFRYLVKARQSAIQTGFSDSEWLMAMEADIRLRQGNLILASNWAETRNFSPGLSPDYIELDSQVTYSRLLIAQGRSQDSRKLLKRLSNFLEKRGLFRWLVTVQILQAITEEKLGNRDEAYDYLSKAILLAVPNDYFRAFLEQDPVIITLLPKVRPAAPGFVDQLMEYAGLPKKWTEAQMQPLVEPLSSRELELLALIVAGYTNQEIAERLVIAKGTVKRHINNIYGKLGVHSRTEAVARAWALRLVERIN